MLRIAASRLSDVLNDVRDLGVVDNEQSGGDDVTTQAIDLDARLRSERMVEEELRALLKSRENAPLDDILQLRDTLAQVRQSIEQLQARRDTLSRQVALATVLVIVRPTDAPAKEDPKPGVFDHFFKEVGGAWDSSMHTLTASIAFLIRAIVGGAVIWIGLLLAAMVLRRVLPKALGERGRPDVMRSH